MEDSVRKGRGGQSERLGLRAGSKSKRGYRHGEVMKSAPETEPRSSEFLQKGKLNMVDEFMESLCVSLRHHQGSPLPWENDCTSGPPAKNHQIKQ